MHNGDSLSARAIIVQAVSPPAMVNLVSVACFRSSPERRFSPYHSSGLLHTIRPALIPELTQYMPTAWIHSDNLENMRTIAAGDCGTQVQDQNRQRETAQRSKSEGTFSTPAHLT